MRKFINLSAKESLELDSPVYKNGIQLINDAKLIAEHNNSYACATSLSILGLEEVVKATLIFLHSKGVKVYLLKGSKKFFSDHKTRHEITQLIEVGSGFFEAHKKWEHYKENKKFKTKSKWFNTIFNEIYKGWKTLEPILETYERINHIEDFDKLKNQGFYVDYRDKILIPFEEINETKYNLVLNNIERIVKFYKVVKIFYHPSIKKHITEDQLIEVNRLIKSFIEDAMTKYEFRKYPKLVLENKR